MEFSIRDALKSSSPLRSQSGQAIVEYLLILVVAVALVLGGIYQLNSAFRVWAQEYFGNYIACLLETGELPSIGGTGGDSTTCNQFFKEFSFSDGRPLLSGNNGPSTSSPQSSAGGTKETQAQGTSGSGTYHPVHRGGGGSGGGFGGGAPPMGMSGRFSAGRKAASTSSSTGDMSAGNYGGGYGPLNRRLDTGVKDKLDTGFAFDNEQDAKQKHRPLGSSAKSGVGGNNKARSIIHPKSLKKDTGPADDTGMTFGGFIRFLIIAAIIIALVLLIGGQVMQIGKSME